MRVVRHSDCSEHQTVCLVSRVTTLINTCRSERKAEDNQQVETNADQLLAPSLSPLSSRFATICHNYYYVFMTALYLGAQ